MSKELPYFKFYPTEWLTGSILLEDLQTQGLFINICCYYWHNNCNLPITTLQRRYNLVTGELKDAYNNLIENNIIELNSNGLIEIKFLKEQWEQAIKYQNILSVAGKKGMEKRWGKNNPLITSKIRKDNIIQKETTKEKGEVSPITPPSSIGSLYNPAINKPTIRVIQEYAVSVCYPMSEQDAEQFINTYESQGWCKMNGAEIKDWRALVRSWKVRSQNGTAPKPQKRLPY